MSIAYFMYPVAIFERSDPLTPYEAAMDMSGSWTSSGHHNLTIKHSSTTMLNSKIFTRNIYHYLL